MISVWNNKGGTGKSSIAYSLINDTDSYYMTNDIYNSITSDIYSKTITEIESEEFLKNQKIIFDGGGHIDETLTNFLKISSLVIIPLEADLNSLTSLSRFYFKLRELNKNIILVINKVENKPSSLKEAKEVIEYLNSEYAIPLKDIYTLPSSRIFKKMFDEEKGINQILNSSKLNAWSFRNIKSDYNLLLDRVAKTI